MNTFELLSPAGGPAQLLAAVQGGADAVYLGARSFSARTGATNFDNEELCTSVKYAHVRGCKVYLALNTLVDDKDFKKAKDLIKYSAQIGIDGFIVQDMGIAYAIKSMAPNIPLHASTQMTVHSALGAKLLKEYGFERVVLSREMTKEEIAEVCSLGIETEVFVHGALCMSYSGKCLMSSMIGGRSGNRGACAQPCRKKYKFGKKEGYFLSLRDLCLAKEIPELQKMGVTSFKIEGRMKTPEYTALVTSIYRKILDSGEFTKEDKEELKEIFCRGDNFTSSYFNGDKKNMIIASVSNDNAGKTASSKLLKKAQTIYKEGNENKKQGINIDFSDSHLTFSLKDKKVSLKIEKEDVPEVLAERIKEQLSKLGSTPFFAKNINVQSDFPVKIANINLARRILTQELESELAKPKEITVNDFDLNITGKNTQKSFTLSAYATTEEQAKACLSEDVERIYVPEHICKNFKNYKQIIPALSPIIKKYEREKVITNLQGATQIYCESIDGIELAKTLNAEIIGGMGLNITNRAALKAYKDIGVKSTALSPELSISAVKDLSESNILPIETVIYGRLPLMITENCLIKEAAGKCVCNASFVDGIGAKFPVLKQGESCRNIIYNSCPLYMGDKPLKCVSFGLMYFSVETEEETKKIIRMIKKEEKYNGIITRGYYSENKSKKVKR